MCIHFLYQIFHFVRRSISSSFSCLFTLCYHFLGCIGISCSPCLLSKIPFSCTTLLPFPPTPPHNLSWLTETRSKMSPASSHLESQNLGKVLTLTICPSLSNFKLTLFINSYDHTITVRYHSGGSMELNARILLLAYMVYL